MTRIFFFSSASLIVSSFSISNDGLIVQDTRLPNMMPVKQRKHPIHGLISSTWPLIALLTNWASHKLARPIIQISALSFAINSSAIQGSVIRPTVATGIDTCFLISSLNNAWEPILVPGAGIELPLAIVVPPETWSISTPAFSNVLET